MSDFRRTTLVTTLVLLLLCAGSGLAQIAIVVNPESSLEDLSLEDLGRVYEGKLTQFEGGTEIHPFEYWPISKQFYSLVLNRSLLKVRKNWMKLIFSGEYVIPPKELNDPEEVEKELTRFAGTICFIRSSEVTDRMKVISIDGLMPEDVGYVLSTDH